MIRIPDDKFDIAALEECWKNAVNDSFDEAWFCKLAAKTYELFCEYRTSDNIPKSLVSLISYMGAFAKFREGELYEPEDIAACIADELVWQLCNGFKLVKSTDNKNIEFSKDYISITYGIEAYQLDTNSFDIASVKEKDYIVY